MKNLKKYDYVTNTLKRTYPRGMDVEIVSFKALKEAHFNAYDPFDREHVTPFIRNRPTQYRLHNIKYSSDLSRYRLTVDTSEDMELIRRIFESLYVENPEFTMKDILSKMAANPDWIKINSHS